MTLTAGAISLVTKGSNAAKLSATAATGGAGPYTEQWYRSTTTGFSPGAGNLISGATALTLSDTGLIPNTTYYYKVVYTDTGNSNATVTATQLAVTTDAPSLNQNQFTETPTLGQMDQAFNYNTHPVQIDLSETGTLYAGSPVKVYDSAGGVPKVVKCAADSDEVLGFINFNIKNRNFLAGYPCEISMAGNVMFLYATAAIARGAKVQLDVANNGVAPITGSSGADIVGWAYDKASAAGDLIRVFILTPSFAKA